jgi:hypothetical protein
MSVRHLCIMCLRGATGHRRETLKVRQDRADNRGMTTTKPMHSRYRIHDSQRTVAASLRRNSAINPRYWVIDKTNGEVVDQFTTRDTAQYFCTSMNCEHRVTGPAAQPPHGSS